VTRAFGVVFVRDAREDHPQRVRLSRVIGPSTVEGSATVGEGALGAGRAPRGVRWRCGSLWGARGRQRGTRTG
jgi:hypothetical protein